MTVSELFELAAGSRGDLELIQERMSDDSRHGLANVLVGRITVAIGQAVDGIFPPNKNAVEMIRRRSLAEALRNLVGLMVLYGVTEDEIVSMLPQRKSGS